MADQRSSNPGSAERAASTLSVVPWWIALVVAAVAAVAAVMAGAEPTGSSTTDVVLVGGVAFLITWISWYAPWWVVAGVLGVAAVTAANGVVIAVGVVACLAYLAVVSVAGPQPITAAVAGGVAVNVMVRSDLARSFGFSMIVGGLLFGVLAIAGVICLPARARRLVISAAAVAAVVVLVSLGAVGLGANQARSDVEAGNDAARTGIDLVSDGAYDQAAERFEQAADDLASADSRLTGPLMAPAKLVPGVAQNVRAGTTLTAQAADALDDAATALRTIDPDSFSFTAGRIDLDAVRAAEEPLIQVQSALDGLQTSIDEVRSPWLIDRVTQELDDLSTDLTDEEPRLQTVIDAVRLAPQILGGDGPRRYLVLFSTTAEARALGGFIGNYAEMNVDDGQISVSELARRSDLEDVLAGSGATCDDCPPQFVERYGDFGFTTGPDGGVDAKAWSNLTVSPHFPYVADVAELLYPPSGGDPIDGVFIMDARVVATLMKYTTPIDIPEFGVTVDSGSALRFILLRQYKLGQGARPDRIDALGTLGSQVIDQLLTGSLPSPPDLARDLAPLVDDRRLMFITTDPDEQEFFDEIGLSGAMPPLDPVNGGFSVSMTNAGGSKIDVFLEREVSVEIETSESGDRTLVADVTLTNNAPTEGLPPVVIGNAFDLPPGTSRLYTTFYGPLSLRTAQRDGEDLDLAPTLEAGWSAYPLFMDLASGESSTFHLEFDLPDQPGGLDGGIGDGTFGEPTIFEQPLSELR